jgi:prophage regulatory protein
MKKSIVRKPVKDKSHNHMSGFSRLVRLPEVLSRVGLSRSSIYKLISDGSFPAAISIGPRSVAWLEDEVDQWIEQKIELRRRSQHD